MQLGVVIGIMIFLGIVGTFLLFAISSSMNSDDANRVDDIPEDLKKTLDQSGNKIS